MEEKGSSSSEEKNKEIKVLEVKSELQCPVTLQLFNQPVCLSSGHTVEKDVADNALNTDKLCPVSRVLITGYSENYAIKNILNKYLTKYPEARKKQYVLGSYGKKSSETSSGYTGPVKPVEQNPVPSAPPLPNDPAVVQAVVQNVPPQEQKQNVNSLVQAAKDFYHGRKKSYENALRLFRLAANEGNAEAQYYLGDMYRKGCWQDDVRKVVVPWDNVIAARWFRAAAEQGHRESQYNLGFLYDSGVGVKQDYVEATRLYRLAAQGGSRLGKNSLNISYKYNRVPFVPQNRAEYQGDVDIGIYEARTYLARIEELETLEAELLSLVAGNLSEFKSAFSEIRSALNKYEMSSENQTAYLQALMTKISALHLSDDIKSYVISWAKLNKLNIDVLQEDYAEIQQNRFDSLSNQLESASTIDEIVNTLDQLCHFIENNGQAIYDKILSGAMKYLSLANETTVSHESEQKMLRILGVIPFSERERYETAEAVMVQIFQKKVERVLGGTPLGQSCTTVPQLFESLQGCVTKFSLFVWHDTIIQTLRDLQRQLLGLNRKVAAVIPSAPPLDDVNNNNNAVVVPVVPSAESNMEIELPSVPAHKIEGADQPEEEREEIKKVVKPIGLTG